ncbi:hypothetical protein [Herbiconiux sp. YIM B11900]|uniref:hypothetical protein n=1 Tax=Herbiconiux sp. YIM B11900 TaxID=3404131 RepID=UPI003F879D59
MAVALGFGSSDALLREGGQLAKLIVAGAPLSRADWTRALLATEIVFVSNIVGSGIDWSITTGFTDDETIEALRRIQRKLGGVVVRPPVTGVLPRSETDEFA